MYSPSANALAFATNGTAALTLSSAQIATFGGVLRSPDGSVSAPTYSFSSSSNTGMFYDGSNGIKLTTNGTLALTISSAQLATFADGITTAGVIKTPDGTVSAPAHTFTNSATTGMYSSAANNLDFAVNGIQALHSSSAVALTLGQANNAQTHTLNGLIWNFTGPTTGSSALGIVLSSNNTSQGNLTMNVSAQAGGGADAYYIAQKGGSTTWSFGYKGSDASFRLSRNSALGTNDCIVIADSTNNPTLKGTATNDNAAAGFVGQQMESVISTATNYASSTHWSDITSLDLTAGDWDVTGVVQFNPNSSTTTQYQHGISTTTGDSGSGLTNGSNNFVRGSDTGVTGLGFGTITIPMYRVSIASTTTHYLKAQATYSAGTPQFQGRLTARRVR